MYMYLHELYLRNVITINSVLHVYIGGKLVRKSFMGVYPDIIKLNTYLIRSERFRWSITVGKTCTPVELRRQNDGTVNKMPENIREL